MKTVLITGTSRGIGLGLVKQYLNKDFKVIATCRSPDTATELTSLLKDQDKLSIFRCDVSSDDSIKECYNCVSNQTGLTHLDVLVNNAGISNKNHPADAATDVDRQEFVDIFNINVGSSLQMTNTFLPLLQGKGTDQEIEPPTVINISSDLASMTVAPFYALTSYQCSKAALNMLTKCQATASPNVKFVALHPGWVQTDMGNANNRTAPTTIEDSVRGIIKTVENVQIEDSGTFWNFEGKQMPY